MNSSKTRRRPSSNINTEVIIEPLLFHLLTEQIAASLIMGGAGAGWRVGKSFQLKETALLLKADGAAANSWSWDGVEEAAFSSAASCNHRRPKVGVLCSPRA